MNLGKLLGRGMSFPPRVGPDGRFAWSEGEENVRESIRVVLLTESGERLMAPEFGGGVGAHLFEPNSVTTRKLLQERIADALRQWEPRVSLESVVVESDPDDARAALVSIVYKLVATQARERLSVGIVLNG